MNVPRHTTAALTLVVVGYRPSSCSYRRRCNNNNIYTEMKKLEAAHHQFQRRLLGIIWKDKIRNEEIRKKTGLRKLELIIKERRLRWLGTCTENGGIQNTSPGYTVGTKRLQEKAGTAKEKLDGHCKTRSEGYEHDLG